MSFKQTNVNAMRGKIAEFDEAFQNELVWLSFSEGGLFSPDVF